MMPENTVQDPLLNIKKQLESWLLLSLEQHKQQLLVLIQLKENTKWVSPGIEKLADLNCISSTSIDYLQNNMAKKISISDKMSQLNYFVTPHVVPSAARDLQNVARIKIIV